MSRPNNLDYVTSDEDCEYNKKTQIKKTKAKEIQIESENELFVDDDSSIDLNRIDQKLTSYENESSKSPHLFSDCNISEIETNLNENPGNNNDSLKKRFSLNKYFKEVKNSQKNAKNNQDNNEDDDIILIDDENDSILSVEKSKPIELIINKPDFSEESNATQSYFSRNSPIQISSENDSIIIKKSDSEKQSLKSFLNLIEDDLIKDENNNNKIDYENDDDDDSSTTQAVALYSTLSDLRVNSPNESGLPDLVSKKPSPNSSSILNCDKLNNSKPIVIVKKLSTQEIEKHTKLNLNNSNNNNNNNNNSSNFKLTLLKNKDSNVYNVKTTVTSSQPSNTSQASSKRGQSVNRKVVNISEESQDSENDFIVRRVKKPKKRESKEASKEEAKKLNPTPTTVHVQRLEKVSKSDPQVKKSETLVKTNEKTSEKTNVTKPLTTPAATKTSTSITATSLTESTSTVNKIKFKIPKISSANTNKSPLKAAVSSTNSATKSNLKKSSESIKKSIKILSAQSAEPKNKLKKQSPPLNNNEQQQKEAKEKTEVSKEKTDSSKKREQPKKSEQPVFELTKEKDSNKAKSQTTRQLISTQPNVNILSLNDKRLQYNKSNGWDYPLYSLSFLVVEHISQLAKHGGSLDFNLLNVNIDKTDSPLCVSNLNKEERLELCKLMSRSAGRFNKYSLFGIDCSLRETLVSSSTDLKKYGRHAHKLRNNSPLEFENETDEDQFLANEIPKLTLSESFILYELFSERLTSPWRKIKVFHDSDLKANSLRVEFINDRLIESTDASYEACVKYVCHRSKYDYLVNSFLFNNVVQEVRDETPKNLIDEAKKKLNDNQVFDKMFLDNFVDRLRKNFDGPMEAPANIYHVNFHPEGYPIVDKTKYVFRERCKRFNVDMPNLDVYNRFDGFITRLNSNRGAMKYALQHKPISVGECNRRLDQIKEGNNFNLDLNEIFDSNSNTN